MYVRKNGCDTGRGKALKCVIVELPFNQVVRGSSPRCLIPLETSAKSLFYAACGVFIFPKKEQAFSNICTFLLFFVTLNVTFCVTLTRVVI